MIPIKHLLLTGDETPEDICAAITNLRIEQRRQVIASTAREFADDIDELIELFAVMCSPVAPPAA